MMRKVAMKEGETAKRRKGLAVSEEKKTSIDMEVILINWTSSNTIDNKFAIDIVKFLRDTHNRHSVDDAVQP